MSTQLVDELDVDEYIEAICNSGVVRVEAILVEKYSVQIVNFKEDESKGTTTYSLRLIGKTYYGDSAKRAIIHFVDEKSIGIPTYNEKLGLITMYVGYNQYSSFLHAITDNEDHVLIIYHESKSGLRQTAELYAYDKANRA